MTSQISERSILFHHLKILFIQVLLTLLIKNSCTQDAPSITSVPSSKNVIENTSANIDCSSNIISVNSSSTSYRWTGPGGYNRTGAVLDRIITRTQGGQYTCTATNTAGLSDTATVNIIVQYAATITSVPNNRDVTENTSPDTDCSSNITPGNPSLTSYRWTGPDGYNKTGAVLDRIVTKTQGGQYTCTATNTAGLSDTATVNVRVQFPPTITSVPNNRDVTENTSPNIDCSSNITPGNPSSTSYRWTGPGSYGKTGAVLDRTVTRTQGGRYTCTATNTAGLSDTGQVNINVQYSPTITSVPSVKNLSENSSPNIDCSSNITPGNPSSTSYNWTGPGGYSKTGAVLDRTFTRVQRGQYTCTATNTAGLSDTGQVDINVQYRPEIISVPNSKNVIEKSRINIDCSTSITPGNPSTTNYRWTGPDGYGKTGAVLDRNITRTQGGQYTCIATNTAGLSDTATVIITVQYLDLPYMIFTPSQVNENDSVQVVCNVTSNPIAKMTITNTDTNTNLVNQVTDSVHYDVENVQCLHNGTYKCVAINHGIPRTRTFSASLNVLCSPRHDFRKNISETVVSDVNTTATMVADIIANPLPTFTWGRYDNGQLKPITENTVHTVNSSGLQTVLEISISQSRDYGIYAVQIENDVGTSLLKYELTSQSPPFPPTEFSYKLTGDKSLTLTWMSMYNGGEEQMFHVEYERMDSDIKYQLQNGIPDPGRHRTVTQDIYEITTNTKYNFTLYSRNMYGDSEVVVLHASITPPTFLGLIVGLSVGLPLFVGLVAAAVILIRRRMLTRKTRTDLATDQNAYSDLHMRVQVIDVYDKINVQKTTEPSNEYENVKFKKKEDESPIYANQPPVRKHEDSPIYENHDSAAKEKQNSSDSSY